MSDFDQTYANLTPEEQAAFENRLQELSKKARPGSLLYRRERSEHIPLSFSQERLWFLHQLEPDLTAYHLAYGYLLKGPLDTALLRQAFAQVIDRHEALRTSFHSFNGRPYQQIAAEVPLPVTITDLSHLPAEQRLSEAKRLASQDATQPFDLTKAPLIRIVIFPITPGETFLYLNIHHLVFDGWSRSIFFNDLRACYDALLKGSAPELPDLPVQFPDFAIWERETLQGDRLKKSLDFWLPYLESPPVLELPTDFPRPQTTTYQGASIFYDFPPELSVAIKNICQQENVTPYMVLLAGFNLLLSRYSGQDDIVLGTVIAGRNHMELENLAGFFANTLVIRTNLKEPATFRELLKQVRENAFAVYAHQDLPFEILVDQLKLPRDPSRNPLFQVDVNMHNTPPEDPSLPGISAQAIPLNIETSHFDLEIHFYDQKDHILNRMMYNTALFRADSIRRLLVHFQVLLKNGTAHPDQPLSEISLLTDAERQEILYTWNQTDREYPVDVFPSLFESQARRTPDEKALVYEDQSLTYQELSVRVNKLALHLKKLGLRPGQFVMVYMERTLDAVASILAIMRAGGAYVATDPAFPSERLRHILESCGAKILITQSDMPNIPAGEGLKTILLDDFWHSQDDSPADLSDLPYPDPESPAYMIYTSGSTGQPKGVVIRHSSVTNYFHCLQETVYSKLPARSLRITLNSMLSFDPSVRQWLMLAAGHCLHLVPPDTRIDGQKLIEFVQDNQIDLLECVTSQLKVMFEAGFPTASGWQPHTVLVGGEAVDPATWQRMSSNRRTRFYNVYGPTECTGHSSYCIANDHPERPLIGRPIPNARFYILDANLQPVPIGIPGELHIASKGLALGYHNRPDLTAEKFIPNPFLPDPAEKMYKTGDLVRYMPDGNIEFLGRTDFQVKLRGYRIELDEISSVLKKMAGIKDAVVNLREDNPGDPYLAAYLESENKSDEQINPLRHQLQEFLPVYMIPRTFEFLDSLPHLPNGKIDRKALPAPTSRKVGLRDAFIAPRTPIEKEIAAIWQDVLHLERVSVDDNFFTIGGHSLLAVQVIMRLNQTFHTDLVLRLLFENQTIAALATTIRKALFAQVEENDLSGILKSVTSKRPDGE